MKLNSTTLYQRLSNEEDTRPCTGISDSACSEVPGNFLKILIAQLSTKLADSFTSSKVVLPWLLASAGAPAFFTALLVPIRESGSLIPQLMLGGIVRQFQHRKQFYVIGSLLQGAAVALMAISALQLNGARLGWTIIVLLIIFSLSRGLCSIANKDVLGKTIPKARRGRLGGLSASLSGIITLLVTGSMLAFQYGSINFVVTMMVIASLFWVFAALSFGLIVEYEGATEGAGNGFKVALKNLNLLRSDNQFQRFVMVRALLMSSGLAAPFIVLLATPHTDLGGVLLFVILTGMANLISGWFWGLLADRSSRHVILLTAALSICIFLCTALFQVTIESALSSMTILVVYLLIYFLLAITHQGVRLGRKTYLIDMADGNQRTDYVSVSNTVIGILLLVYGAISAVIAQCSITAVLILFSVSSCAALLIALKLKEI
ncbi:MFS transporter [Vibrio crassostreae]|uniref:MFS transporter n=1 Tax=Vibrio crassostreae TaxID=246167 RepID=UPI001B30CB9E|nr:MFS transporter [Vibrio crassostreae]CAK2112010.1 MFS transporter [Vibrio crassostreae]CAK2116585.1 MFS transporter [Vibrio crassostreae]CAK2122741.1 MFS transporter [Vibrio crassostreae]CAK2123345.1 MFS transporter [Vibrio crassostreae]CAK2124374.1 MFS transporter [Vibrio crassostreae]